MIDNGGLTEGLDIVVNNALATFATSVVQVQIRVKAGGRAVAGGSGRSSKVGG